MAAPRDATEEELRQLGILPAEPTTPKVRSATAEELQQLEASAPTLGQRITGALQPAERVAGEFNAGVLSMLGLGSLASRVGLGSVRPEGEDPTLLDAAARSTGAGIGTAGALIAPQLRALAQTPAAAQILQPAQATLRSAAGEFSRRAAQSAAQRPGAFWGLEVGASAAAGAAGEGAARVTDSPTARFLTELAAGGAVAAGPNAMALATHSPGVRVAKGVMRSVRGEPAGADYPAAAQRLRQVTPDLEGALARAQGADVLPGAPLTTAELSGDPGLLALQKANVEASESLNLENRRRFADVNQLTQDALRALPGEVERVTPQESRAYLQTLIDERIHIARAAVDEKVAALGPQGNREAANRAARDELSLAYQDVLDQESELWDAVDLSVNVIPQNAREAYVGFMQRMQGDRVSLGRRIVPEQVRRFLGDFDPETGTLVGGQFNESMPTAREIRSLRGALLEAATAERAKPSPNRERLAMLGRMQGALLKDLSSIPHSEQLDLARGFSNDINTAFRQGEVGSILGFDATGASSRPDLLTLERSVGRRGMAGAEATDQILGAVRMAQRDPAMRQHMETYLTDEFLRAAAPDGEINPRAASRYLQSRQDVLSRFPELRQRFVEATQAGSALLTATRVEDPAQAAAALVLRAPPGSEIARLVRSPNPRQGATELMAMLATDPSGRATQGMRSALTDWLVDSAIPTGAAPDARGAPTMSGTTLTRLVRGENTRPVIEAVLTPEQVKRLDQIANTIAAAERGQRTAAAPGGVMERNEPLLLRYARQFGAASLGRSAARAANSGGTMTIPARTVQLSEELMERGINPARKLVSDAIMSPDPTLLNTLTMETPLTPRRQEIVNARLNAWAAAVAAQHGIRLYERNDDARP